MKLAASTLLFFYTAGCINNQYVREHNEQPLHKSAISIETPIRITAGNESNFSPNLSPNGKFVFFVTDRNGNKDIWRKKIGGGIGDVITEHPADDFAPEISPDGKYLAFVSRREDASGDIHVMDLGLSLSRATGNKENPNKNISLKRSEDLDPAWFPNSQKLVFSARYPGQIEPQLMMVDMEDLKPQPIVGAKGSQAKVSPDGNWIVFVSNANIFVYDVRKEKNIALTNDKDAINGQPSFSPDGKEVFFSRYIEDSNGDGKFDGDDYAVIAKFDFDQQLNAKNKDNYRIQYLTNPELRGTSPQVLGDKLYFSLQNKESLDIFSLPLEGQISALVPDEVLFQWLEENLSTREKLLIIRTLQIRVGTENHSKISGLAIRELRELVVVNKSKEARYVFEKILKNFTDEKTIDLANIDLVNLILNPIAYPEYKGSLDQETLKNLKLASKKIEGIIEKSEDNEVYARGSLVKARILATQKKYFDAEAILTKLEGNSNESIVSEAAFYKAQISPAIVGIEETLLRFVRFIESNKLKKPIVRRASNFAVGLAVDSKDPQKYLQLLKDESASLPTLPALTHSEIVKFFRKRGNEAVATNEMREIIYIYQDSPEIQIETLKNLLKIEEKNARYDLATKLLKFTKENLAKNNSQYIEQINKLVTDFNLRRGRSLLREKNYEKALVVFERILRLDQSNISAHRGKIDSYFKLGRLQEVVNYYITKLEQEPTGSNFYYLGYAKTYYADQAKSRSQRVSLLKDAFDDLIEARTRDSSMVQLHQTLGWVNQQISFWTQKELDSGSWTADVSNRWSIVQNFFGFGDQNWSQQSIDSLLTAYYLSDDGSIEQSGVLQNLGNTYFTLKNYKKALFYYLKRIQLFSSVKAESPENEAIVFDRAGRSAFQIDETTLGAKLQFQAATIWRELGSKENYAKSLDAMALSLRENKKFAEAHEIYSQLLLVQRSLESKNNIANSLINRAWMDYRLGNVNKSLVDLDEALKLLEHQNDEGDSKNENEVISVNLASAGSASKGFNVEERKLLIFGLRKLIYANISRNDLVLEQINRLFESLGKIKKQGIEAGQPDLFKSEHLAINRNNVAFLYRDLGDVDNAIARFIEAADISKQLRNSDQKYANNDEVVNLGNAIALELSVAVTSTPSKRLAELRKRALSEIKPLEDIVRKGALNEANSLLNLYFHLAKIEEQAGNLELSQKLLSKGLLVTDKYQLFASNYAQSIYISTQAYALQMDESKRGIELSRKIRKEVFNSRDKARDYVMAKAGKGDFEVEYANVMGGALLNSKSQFVNFRKSLDVSIANNISNDEKLYEIVSRYSFAINLSTVFPQRVFDKRSSRKEALLSVHNEELDVEADFIYALIRDTNELMVIGKNYDGEVFKYLIDEPNENKLNQFLTKESSAEGRALYIVPIGASYNIGWNRLEALKNRNWSITPSKEFVKLSEQNWKSGILNISVLHDQGSTYASEVLEKKAAKLAGIGQQYRNVFADLFIIEGVFEDYQHNGSTSRFLDTRDASDSSFSLLDLSSFDLKNASTILIPNLLKVDWGQKLVNADDYSWIYLANAGLSSGVSNLVLYEKHQSIEIRDVLEMIENKNVAETANVTGAIKIGYVGMPYNEEMESMAEELGDILESAEIGFDDEVFEEAIREYQKLYIRSVKLKKPEMRNTALEGLVNSNYRVKNYNDAMRYKLKILKNIRKNMTQKGDEADYDMIDAGEALVDAAVLAVRAKHTDEATKLLDQAQSIFEEEDDDMVLGKIAHYRGINFETSGLYKETIDSYQASFGKYQITDPKKAAQRILDIANVYRNKIGNYAIALAKYEEARNFFKKIGSTSEIKSIEIDRANTLMAMGEINRSIEILRDSVISNIDAQKDPWEYARANGILANAYYRAGDFDEANETNRIASESAENISVASRKLTVTLDVLNLKAMVLAKLGKYEESDAAFLKGIEIAKKNVINGKLALYYNNYGFWLRERGLIDESIIYFKMALEIDDKLNDITAVAYDNRNLGLSLIVKRDYIKARDLLKNSLKVSAANGLIYNAVYCHLGLGDIALKEEDFSGAYSAFNSAFEMAHKTGMKDFEWRALSGMGASKVKLDDSPTAINEFTKATKIVESLVSGLKSEDSKNGFHSDRGVQQLYRDLTLVLYSSGKITESWQTANISRKKYLLDKVSNKKQVSAGIEIQDKAYPSIDKISLSKMQQVIGESDLLIDYFVTNEDIIIWTISKSGIRSVKVAVEKVYLKQLVADYRDLLEKYSTTRYLGQELSNLLLKPIANELQQKNRIFIVGSDILNYVSFAGLNWQDRYLVDDFQISYFDSTYKIASLLNIPEKKISKKSTIVAFTNPKRIGTSDIPFSSKEALTFKRYFKRVEIFKAEQASVSNFQANSASYDIIHIGAHGEFDPLNPMDAKLLLAQRQSQKSELRPIDILGKPLKAELVTLSSCNSGLGAILDGQNDLGLKSAFEIAGVKSLVTTLWRIDDVTSAVVMKRFYRYLADGESKTAALRKAQLVAKQYFEHPAYWASFKLSGDFR